MRYHNQRTRVPFQQLRPTLKCKQNVTGTNQTPPFPHETTLHRILCDTQSLLAPILILRLFPQDFITPPFADEF